MSEFSGQIGFVSLPELGSGNPGQDDLWPCVCFRDVNHFLLRQNNLFQLLDHPTRHYSEEAISLLLSNTSMEANNNSQNIVLVYLLGEPHDISLRPVRLLKWTKNFCKVTEEFASDKGLSTGRSGFKDAWCEALLLHLGPEFSPARLRFGYLTFRRGDVQGGVGVFRQEEYHEDHDEDSDDELHVLWPCMLFDNWQNLVEGLQERNLLGNKELVLSREFIQIYHSSNPGHNTPPYVFFFAGNGRDGNYIDDDYHHLFDFHVHCARAFLDNVLNEDFRAAMYQAALACRSSE